MVLRNPVATVSILSALVFPAVVLLLLLFRPDGLELSEPVAVAGIVAVVFLCPLAAAFCGHAARRQIRKSGRDAARGNTLALTGLSLGYIELTCTAVLLVGSLPHHPTRIAIYEASAVGSLRTVNRAERAYLEAHPQEGFTKDLRGLLSSNSRSANDWYIDETLASGTKSHYRFTYIPRSSKQNSVVFDKYQVFADPAKPSEQYMRHFYTDQTGAIRCALGGPASESSQELK